MRKNELAKWLKKQIIENFNKGTELKCSEIDREYFIGKEQAYVHALWYVLGSPKMEEFSEILKKLYK